MWRALASNMLTVLIVALFLLGGVIMWGQSQYTSEGPLEQAICLRVKSGSNMTRVSRTLEDQGAVTSGALFRVGVKYSDKASLLKAGSYLVQPGASMEEIVDQITRGGASTCGTEIVYRVGVTRVLAEVRELDPASNRFVERAEFNPAEDEAPAEYLEKKAEADTRFRIALAEGVTSWQVTEALKSMDILEGDPGERPPEGMLAPDSYEVTPGDERAAILAEMQERQLLRINAAWEGRSADAAVETPEEMLILASIIEKETGVAEERGQVASVFTNRLKRGMRLQTDPTVIYGVTQGEGVLGRGLRQSELRRVTPWNTYVIEGLPPTPIANPGFASLEAAVNPDETDYLFFVADGTGGHAFAETLAEHNRNVVKWRQIEAERSSD
ncbi:endolytic transglycosylase MltG [Phaeobacter gallaeciensis]|uniref:endolytic transglycosylase MltG n=1 Tax=Phaeobacter gallaeciensis TaxID=60890 RepID=UPI00237FA976|nr:endolytic transglycosylase MltG [Phaeobacter gallaeciensis]MDE4096623.1 endolytic transglycosylase MltG [Phaeobacter gallaeciensis]MDE4105434.1 endolytic transglycosylase MltG [Phaeobacter gallaeciensis]MDE4109890.1 endolytic transglycosylase MltG [Phaeobacter gallaeciensis]MDE4114358.1 endolytic transglycosylase MltG [Phaeobacter gallaeciensis]MDE4118825.1 endolytic transglycosylase MltG [Phaeobacter gallaeciensis]